MDVKRSKSEAFMLRFPDGMRERLKVAAEANGRSMNSEIILRLENALDRQDDGTIAVWIPPEVLARVHAEANLRETDPNLLILDAIEKVYPPRPSFKERVRALMNDVDAGDLLTAEDEALFKVAGEILGQPRVGKRKSHPWAKG